MNDILNTEGQSSYMRLVTGLVVVLFPMSAPHVDWLAKPQAVN